MDNNNDYIKLPYLEVKQPIGSFYICTMSWSDILATSFADIRDIEESADKGELDNYLGIQRTVSKGRIKEISQYVKNIDATFPTSIILHIKSESLYHNGKQLVTRDEEYLNKHADEIETIENIKIVTSENKLHIRNNENVAKILDGQHRIEGCRAAAKEGETFSDFDFNVTIFVDLDLDDQAQIFSVINKAQTKVNKSLVYDLYEYANNRSPQKTAHDIVRLLNKSDKSAFYRKVKILGTAKDKQKETIAQATLAELIIDSISKNPMKDRDALKRKSILGSKGLKKEVDPKEITRRIFRNQFISEGDVLIFKTINNFYNAVSTKWPQAWSNQPEIEKNIISKSTGIVALFRFMRYVYVSKGYRDEVVSEEIFKNILNDITLVDNDFTTDNYKPGSSGQSQLFRELKEEYDKKLSS